MMRAMLVTAFGGADIFHWSERALSTLKAAEVRIRIRVGSLDPGIPPPRGTEVGEPSESTIQEAHELLEVATGKPVLMVGGQRR